MNKLAYDFHIHSCLSPCGDDDMTPANIAGMAYLNGLDVIALTDHNTCRNCSPLIRAAAEYGITVIPGMELTTSEEIHVLCLFSSLDDALNFDGFVYSNLPDIKNNENIFGKQSIINYEDQICGSIDKLLINATLISFDNLPGIINRFNGIIIPAHITKSSDSLLSVFGTIPPSSTFICAEINKCEDITSVIEKNPYLKSCRIITDSDAHYLTDIHEKNNFIHCDEKKPENILAYLKSTV